MLRILLLGDSLLARYEGAKQPMINYQLGVLNPDVVIDNWALAGQTSADVLNQLKQTSIRKKYDKVCLLIGTNDARYQTIKPVNFAENLLAITTYLTDFSVILITPPPVDESKQRPKRTNANLRQYGKIVSELADKHQYQLIDLYHLFHRQTNWLELLKGQLDDGLHFGETGYKLLATAINTQIQLR
ncbi:lysophospholipase L1-like esterase [Weissella beninensis]|uniref:SGNH hydrolase-type esterase domain-containing protein n=1 Tax=Periweissella beninensis TaxID=504936 RepID=A0ABT0VIY4_9LACO|nr:GDSL-type esterase/lipase family protein [Periweissella beninensis]MBM7543900.1 lysophospholipase L1-like esterase [Periweissella beninensis]MCM2437626.1 hypothetical protein [Periweissella beninensis]